jgi:hypothetical protein
MTYRSCSGNIGIKYTKKEHMKYGYTSIWKCLFKKELFDKYNITFPNCHSEARAVYAFIVAVSNKIANVEEGLYFYRRFRENSLSGNPRKNNGDEHALGLRAFEALIEKFSSAGIYDEYKDILEEIIKYKLSDILATSFYRRTKDEYDMLLNKYNCFISEKIPGAINYEYIILGGYNLNRILWNMNVIHSPYNRFNFSSIISVMHPVKNITIEHKNIYRKIMVNRDVQSDFWDIYEYSNASHIFIDLVEERFDILKLNEGYITKSDAWDNSEKCPCQGTICRLSAECDALWKNSFDDFVKKARTVKNNVKIIVVENFLALSYGDILCQTEYKDVESIREINKKLKSYYSYINEKYPELIMIKTSECDNYFTDDKYEYGVQPSHLNDWVNRKITEMIEERMEAI